jgi:hypothetical protein
MRLMPLIDYGQSWVRPHVRRAHKVASLRVGFAFLDFCRACRLQHFSSSLVVATKSQAVALAVP